jgi:hypothetical protein
VIMTSWPGMANQARNALNTCATEHLNRDLNRAHVRPVYLLVGTRIYHAFLNF